MSRAPLTFAAFLAGALALGCRTPEVTRIVDGRPEQGPFISEGAYALYARGALAETSGDIDGALRAYHWAAGYDASSPEAWVRIGAIECARAPANRPSDDASRDLAASAFERAESLRADFAPLLRERARCELARGDSARGLVDARRALALDPDDLDTGLVHADALRVGPTPEDAVWALRSLAVRHPGSALPWRALEAIARASRDVRLLREARERIAGLSEDRAERRSEPSFVTRVDAALQGGRLAEARRFAAKAHLASADVAVRAAALGIAALAVEQAEIVIAADPADSSARIALAAAADLRGDVALLRTSLRAIPKAASPPSDLARWLFADVLRRRVSRDAALRWFGPLPARDAPAPGDPLLDALFDALLDATARRVRRALEAERTN